MTKKERNTQFYRQMWSSKAKENWSHLLV